MDEVLGPDSAARAGTSQPFSGGVFLFVGSKSRQSVNFSFACSCPSSSSRVSDYATAVGDWALCLDSLKMIRLHGHSM